MRVVREPWLTAGVEDIAEVFKFCVPHPDSVFVVGLPFYCRGPESECVVKSEEKKCGADDWDIQPWPSSEYRRCEVVVQLGPFPSVDQGQRLYRQDVTRDDEEDSHREMPTRKECAYEVEAGEMVLIVEPKSAFENS